MHSQHCTVLNSTHSHARKLPSSTSLRKLFASCSYPWTAPTAEKLTLYMPAAGPTRLLPAMQSLHALSCRGSRQLILLHTSLELRAALLQSPNGGRPRMLLLNAPEAQSTLRTPLMQSRSKLLTKLPHIRCKAKHPFTNCPAEGQEVSGRPRLLNTYQYNACLSDHAPSGQPVIPTLTSTIMRIACEKNTSKTCESTLCTWSVHTSYSLIAALAAEQC
jgi:hypothetical protein